MIKQFAPQLLAITQAEGLRFVSVGVSVEFWNSSCGINCSQRYIPVKVSPDYFDFLLTLTDSTVSLSYLIDVPNLSLCMVVINFVFS
jgi:hypothetical protein